MSDLTLYGHILSQPTRSVLTYLKLSSIPYTYEHIELSIDANLSDDFKKINPYALVPAIVHSGFNLWESAAIIPYLSTAFNIDNQWYPKDPKQRSRIDAFLHWHHNNLRQPGVDYVWDKVINPKVFGFPEISEECETRERKNFLETLESLKWVLSESGYVARSSEPTIADVFAFNEVDNARCLFQLEEFPEIKKWYDEIEEVDVVKELTEQAREVRASVMGFRF